MCRPRFALALRRGVVLAALLVGSVGPVACRDGPPTDGDLGGWWRPAVEATWFWQLTGELDLDRPVDVYDVDFETTATVVQELRARGKHVIAYVPVGNWEPYRADAADYPEEALCGPIPGWDERYVDLRHPGALAIVRSRIATAAARGFNGIEGDVVDLHLVETGCDPPITEAEMTTALTGLAALAHGLGLAYFAKNVPENAAAWSAFVDGVVVEEAYRYEEQAGYGPYVAAGKPVLAVEYGEDAPTDAQCVDAIARGYALYGTDRALTGAVFRTCW